LNEVFRLCGPVWANCPIKDPLSAMFFTKYALDMLVEHTKKTFRAVERLEIPEASSVPAFPHDLGLGGGGPAKSLFLFVKRIYKFNHNFLKLLKMLAILNIIDRSTSQPVGWCL
jgi:hypothetical protein